MAEKQKDPVLKHLDLRVVEARKTEAWKKALIASLRGDVPPGKMEMVEQACILKFLLDTVNRTMLEKATTKEPIGAYLRDHARLTQELEKMVRGIGADTETSLEKIRREMAQ